MLVAAYSMLLSASQIVLKFGINALGGLRLRELTDLLPILIRVVTNFPIVLGISLMASSFFIWFYILSLYKLSLAMPLSAMTFLFTVVMSAIFLGETLTVWNIVGTLIICFGVFVLLH